MGQDRIVKLWIVAILRLFLWSIPNIATSAVYTILQVSIVLVFELSNSLLLKYDVIGHILSLLCARFSLVNLRVASVGRTIT